MPAAPAPPFGPARRLFLRLNLFGLLVAILLGLFLTLDALTEQPGTAEDVAFYARDAEARPPAMLHHGGQRRAFIFLIDGLRWETATDPARMPHLVALQRKGTFARVITTRDAVTVPAVRAAFTGVEQVAVLGFVKNFMRRDEGLYSLFTQLRHRGLRTAAYSDGSFVQFGHDIADQLSNQHPGADVVEGQAAAVNAALEDYLSGHHDVVIAHITFTDQAAHQYGIFHEQYRRRFASADEMVDQLDRAVPAEETLLVMGDHGHTENGRHGMGLDVPTYASYRGPGYRAGIDLGTIPITSHRYLLGWGLSLPLPPDYRGARYPAALASDHGLPADYASAGGADGPAPTPSRTTQENLALLVVACVGIAAALWLRLQRDVDAGGPVTWWRVAAVWLVAGLLALPSRLPWSALLAGVLGVVLLRVTSRRDSLPGWAWALLALTGGLACHAWGYLLASVRVLVHEPALGTLFLFWAGVGVAGAWASRRFGAMRVAWVVLAVPLVLSYPTVFRYGSIAAMTPAWLCWAAFVAAEMHRRAEGADRGLRTVTLQSAPLVLLLVLLEPFLMPEGDPNFRFMRWHGPVETTMQWRLLALAGKTIIFCRWGAGPLATVAGLAAVVFLSAVEFGQLVLEPAQTVALVALLLLGGLLLARELRRVAILAGLFLAYYYLVRVPEHFHWWADCLMAALVVSARWIRSRGDTAMIRASHAYLLPVGLLVGGWVTLGWTLHELEWHALYDWFPAATVEGSVAWFVPLIVMKVAFPVVMIRYLLARELRDASPYPRRTVWTLAGGKLLTLGLVTSGIGAYDAASDVYLEAVQQTTIWCALLGGLL